MNLSDFFIADPGDAAALDIESSPIGRFPGFEAKGVEIVKILTLLSLIDGSDVMSNIDHIDSYFVQQSDETWLVAIPDAIRSHLSTAGDQQLASLARRWAETEEWQLDGGEEEDLRWILDEMAKLSAEATHNNQKLYLWICL